MTNIKCAKLYIQALVYHNNESLKLGDVDYLPSMKKN